MSIKSWVPSRRTPSPAKNTQDAPTPSTDGSALRPRAPLGTPTSAPNASSHSSLSSLMGRRRSNAAPSIVTTGQSSATSVSAMRASLSSASSSLARLSTRAFQFTAHQALFGNPQQRMTVSPYTAMQIKKGMAEGKLQEVSIEGHAGKLNGHLHKSQAAVHSGKTVLFLSGSAGTAEDQSLGIAAKYAEGGADVLALNYRGFGSSDGVPSENGLMSDAQAMLNHLIKDKGIHPSDIIVHAYSLGGPVGAHVSSMSAFAGRPLGGLVLDRPMVSSSKGAEAFGTPMAKLSGQVVKQTQGAFSVMENMLHVPKDGSVMLLTDRESLGQSGEVLRGRLKEQGFQIAGQALGCGHEDSHTAMETAFGSIQQQFLAKRAAAPTE